jgi:hypothetical protein
MSGAGGNFGSRIFTALVAGQHSVRLYRTKSGKRFTVTYGKQVTRGLTYKQAADELGSSIMHALACNGMVDNG